MVQVRFLCFTFYIIYKIIFICAWTHQNRRCTLSGCPGQPNGHGSRMQPGNGPCIDGPYQKPVRVHGPIDRFGSRVSSPVDPWSCMLCNIDFSFFFHFPIQKRIFIRIDNRVYCSINLSISCCCF